MDFALYVDKKYLKYKIAKWIKCKLITTFIFYIRKLTLSKLNWVFFCKKEKYNERYAIVLEGITREIEKINKFDENPENRRGSYIEDERFIYNEIPMQSLSDSNNGRFYNYKEKIPVSVDSDNIVVYRHNFYIY